MEAAAASGMTQAKVSRLENGRHTPDPDDISQLARTYHAPARVRRRLEQTARNLVEGRVYSRIVLQRGAWRMQERAGQIEAESERIRTFQPTLVPGLLQTRDYARVVFASVGMTGETLERTVDARLNRQQLLDTDREFVELITEGALLWQLNNSELMVEQIQHIMREMIRPNVRVGIITHEKPANVVVQEGFNLYDQRAVIIGTTTATATITDASDVAIYDDLFNALQNLADFDEAAVRELSRIVEVYRH